MKEVGKNHYYAPSLKKRTVLSTPPAPALDPEISHGAKFLRRFIGHPVCDRYM